jgi:hypothetical protein
MKGRARTHRQLDIENFFQPKNALVTPPLQKMETIASSSETKVETTALALKQKGLRRHIHTRRKVQKPIYYNLQALFTSFITIYKPCTVLNRSRCKCLLLFLIIFRLCFYIGT